MVLSALSSADRWSDLNACPTQSSFVVTAVLRDPVSMSLINGEVCRAFLASRARCTGDTAALAVALDIKTPTEIQYDVTEKGASLRPLKNTNRLLQHRAILRRLRKLQWNMCFTKLQMQDSLAEIAAGAKGPREDCRETSPLDVPTGAPSCFARPAAHLGEHNLAQR